MALRDILRVLVVDDMSTSRSLLIMALEEIGIKNIDFAVDGGGAVQSLSKRPVHLVISDYNMPGMDGLGLLKVLRGHSATSKIGFILVSGRVDEALISTGRALGMNNFIAKPFSSEQMKACIQAVTGPL